MRQDSDRELMWSRGRTRRRLEHRDEDVQAWAASRILEMYPEAQAEGRKE